MSTDGATVADVRGDPDHPLTRGYMCIKGMMSAEAVGRLERNKTPLKRLPDGSYGDIAPNAALDEVHETLSRVIAQYGPASVAVYYGTGLKMTIRPVYRE